MDLVEAYTERQVRFILIQDMSFISDKTVLLDVNPWES